MINNWPARNCTDLDHTRAACLQILSQCEPAAVGSAAGINNKDQDFCWVSEMHGWGWHAFVSSGSGSKCAFGRGQNVQKSSLINSPVQGPWCPSSREQEATWSTLKRKSRFWRKAAHQLFKWSDALEGLALVKKCDQLVAERCQAVEEEKPRRLQRNQCWERASCQLPANVCVCGVGRLARHPVVVIFCFSFQHSASSFCQ